MIKKLLFIIPVVFMIGCDTKAVNFRKFKWAAVNIDQIQNAVKEDYKALNPYPKEIDRRIQPRSA